MSKFMIPLVTALLLCTACCGHRKACSTRYCPPNAPTRPVCQPAENKPKCGCKKKKSSASRLYQREQQTRLVAPTRRTITLGEVLDHLPGLPPGYLSI